MADSDITIDDANAVDRKVDTRTVGAGNDEHRQVVVVGDPTTAAGVAGADATNGLDVDVTRIAAGTNLIGKVQLSDGTSDATVRNLSANDALNVAIVDGSGNHITSIGGTGGTSATDDADFTAGSTTGTPIMGSYQSSVTAVTDTDMGIVGIDANRRMKVTVDASALDVAHDAVDANAPVKVGGQARSTLPTAVASADRVNSIADLFGRMLTGHISGEMAVWKSANYTSTQTGSTIWDPASGKRIAITSIVIGSYGTTAARLLLWYGANGDVTYSAGSDQLVFGASFAPSSTTKPGAVFTPAVPIYCTTADHELHITTDAGLSVDIAVTGYEW